jgi:hypothetical protein
MRVFPGNLTTQQCARERRELDCRGRGARSTAAGPAPELDGATCRGSEIGRMVALHLWIAIVHIQNLGRITDVYVLYLSWIPRKGGRYPTED